MTKCTKCSHDADVQFCDRRKQAIRLLTKSSTVRCDVDKYTYFLITEPKWDGCCRLAEILGISRHSSNRFLLRREFSKTEVVAIMLRSDSMSQS